MNDLTRSVLLGVLTVVAVAVAAATIDSSSTGGPIGGGEDDESGLFPPPQNGTTPGETLQIPFLSEILTILSVLLIAVFLLYLYMYWRTALKSLVALAVATVVLYFLFTELLSLLELPTSSPPEPGNGTLFGDGGGGGSGGEDDPTEQPSLPSVLVLLLLVVALFGTVVAFLKTQPTNDQATPTESPSREVDTAAVGEVAGEAADRLRQESDIDNEVYRAWREMTELLDVSDPETSTPDEFAIAAVEAGMNEDDVQDLTRLFEDVRYGDVEPSAEREERAVAIFRRIETRYTEGEP